jgi:glycosyltransferase involved in cell wall biosynthesis
MKVDFQLLKKHFDVKTFFWPEKKGFIKNPRHITELFQKTMWSDLTFSWFADVHAFVAILLSKMFRKKSIVVVGGYEVAKIPEISYGLLLDSQSTYILKSIFKNVDKALTVDDGLKKDAIKNLKINGSNIKTVPTGHDYKRFKCYGEKENLILTVCATKTWKRAVLKGLDIFVKSARFLPNTKFLVIGAEGDARIKLQSIASQNVRFLDHLSQEEIISYYQKSKVYCQLSMREGLPSSLCEAMLCECIPVGTDVQGVTTAMGKTGFYVHHRDPKVVANTIKKALKSKKGKEARKRIKEMFPIERREKDLVSIINNLLRVDV